MIVTVPDASFLVDYTPGVLYILALSTPELDVGIITHFVAEICFADPLSRYSTFKVSPSRYY
jgi:hypothetical protein